MKSMIFVGALVLVANASAMAVGPEWVEPEGMDAGDKPNNAQSPQGEGRLSTIRGRLEGSNPLAGIDDFEDMYLIRITQPTQFRIETTGGAADFDTQLWVFDINGFGLLGNDDAPLGLAGTDTGSSIGQFATDATRSGIFRPGNYFICISGAGNTPTSNALDMFAFQSSTEVSGPDGKGGGGIIDGWSPTGAIGNYIITLDAVEFVPGPSGIMLLVLAPMMSRRRRRS